MASTQAATTCSEQHPLPASIHNILLERLLIAAISALASATATLGFIKWRIRRQRKLQEQRVSAKEDEQDEEEEEEAEREEDIVLAKQLAWAEHRIKELEALIAKAVSKEAEAERTAQAASKAASEATQKVRDAARQLSEGRARTERLERAQEALILERNNALNEAEQASSQQREAELKQDKAQEAVVGLERKLKVQGEERKGHDRRIKDLELRLTSILSAKARDDEEHASRVKVLEEQAAEAAAARAAAEADLARVKGKGSDIQRKARPSILRPETSFYLFRVEAASVSVTNMRREMQARERRAAELEAALGSLRDKSAATDAQLAASRQRVRELEVELRISQESLRRCDERLRGVLKERQDMESRLRRASSR
ncbi:hypothetical protein COCSUDRAFT_49250 [Coccomyxa subellipsoidea C-169]|uniref:Uncharacterized protein n=1 Tax=Coccomyxa subellipsoidea (strain C-169) TaxID=574566 RepID=I0YJH8_COCSC|nr:hypothetical protein COCSUDRAFT_49250 [Coccomyxa subellipsoidea C-169]EIE18547.1 hypothetical protein COCSUDRAFT_49250 [Coccomyxa subellipsoidea C-169]|eukprot:XP_005643091.1 hypothetical protein COCSUDRAFT_49250 [Coccomyxa subellipsoidea C-169]